MFGENGEVSIFWKRNIFLVSGLKVFVQFTLTCQADELTILLADNYADTEGYISLKVATISWVVMPLA